MLKTVILAKTLVDGTGRDPIEHPVLTVEDGRIQSVESMGTPHIPDNTSVIDMGDRTILPGLIDAHTHLVFSVEETVVSDLHMEGNELLAIRAVENARRCLHAGITTVRDCGDRNGVTLALREAVERGIVMGPRVVVSGPPITTTRGHLHYIGIKADDEQAIREAARSLIGRGVDWLKVCATGGGMTPISNSNRAQYSAKVLTALVEEAHAAGKRVAAHAHGTEGIRNAVLAGIDSIEHCSWSGMEEGVEYDEVTVERIKAKGLYICHTIAGERVVSEEAVREAREKGPQGGLGLQWRALKAGARMVLGSDAGIPGTRFEDFPRSLEVAVKLAHFSEREALLAVTKTASEMLGLDREIGTVAPGKRADLIVVEGNPLEDITVLRNIEHVFKDGELVQQIPGPSDGSRGSSFV